MILVWIVVAALVVVAPPVGLTVLVVLLLARQIMVGVWYRYVKEMSQEELQELLEDLEG